MFKWLLNALAWTGVFGLKFDGGGGGSSTATQYTSNIPQYAEGPFMDLVGKAEALSQQPYQTYTGPRIQGFDTLQNQSFNRAQTLSGASFANPGMSSAYMSPYMQNVVDIQAREAMRDAGIQQTQRNAQAVRAGAFGGSRQAIMDAEAMRNLNTNLSDIRGRGLQAAFEQGRNQFNTEFGQQMDTTQMLNQLGGQRQQLGQRQLDQQYGDFQAQRDYPYQQLGFLSDILRGVSGSTRTMYSSQPQMGGLQALAGLGTAAAGVGRLFKEGGEVQGYAAGGIADVRTLTDQLSQMSDTGLQQYAQMHKDDPYTAALAVAEARRRQRMRAASQQGGDMPQQGTVLDREIESMAAPEDMGIAAAASEDLDYADGGIVGYADGGDLEAQRMSDREGIAQFGRAVWEQMKRAGAAIADVGTLPLRGVAGAYDTAVVRPMRAAGANAAYLSPYLVPEGADVDSMTPFYDRLRAGEAAGGADTGDETARLASRYPAPAGIAALAEEQGPPAPGAPAAAPSRAVPQAPGSSSTSVRASGIAAASDRMPDFGLTAAEKSARSDIERVAQLKREAAQQDLADFEKEAAARAPAGAEKEARIKERQGELDAQRQKAGSMALVQAGLSILSADPSRGGLAAIGEGALKGLSAYKGDIKEIEATRERLMEQMDDITELRRKEAEATGAEKRRLRGLIRQADIEGAQSMAALGQKLGLEVKPKYALSAWQEMQANARASLQARATAAGRSNNTLEIAQAYAASKNIPLHQAIQEISAKGGGFDPREAYTDYLKSFKPDPLNPGAQPMTFGAFSRMFPPTPVAAPGQGATIRP